MDFVTATGTILGIVAVMLIRDWRDGKPLFKKVSSGSIIETAEYLKSRYNHELTALLTELQVGQSEIKDILKDFERNGIRVRK